MKFVVKLFPEITIKSKPVRKQLISQLRRNIQRTLTHHGIDVKVQGQWDNIELHIEDDNLEQGARDLLVKIPGIEKVQTVKEFNFQTFDDIFQIAMEQFADKLADKTFCVRVKRTGDHDFNSTDVERYVGGGLLKHTDAKNVQLKKPDVTVKLDIRKQRLHTITQEDKGLGGFPIGCQDSVLSLVSGGFDSNVASYLMMRRGMQTHFLFFNLGGSAHEIGVKQVAHYLWENYSVSHGVKFITIPFEGVVTEILERIDNSYMGVVLKRMMLRAGSQIAESMGIDALVTGESIAQVSSQTLKNLKVIDGVTDTLVLRPLVTMDKPEIINISREIDTYDFAANMPEYCGVISRKPTTRAKIEKVVHEEARFNFEVLDKAVYDTKFERIQNVLVGQKGVTDVELISVPGSDDIIVDIRHPQEEEQQPLHLTNNEIVKMPFYKLAQQAHDLPHDKTLLLYCSKGTMSQLHAEHLIQQGFENIKVFKPNK